MDELGNRLEDLGIEVGVEFLYYAELCETFWRIKKLGSRKSCSSLVQAQETHTLCVFDRLPVVSWRRAKYKQMYGLKSTLTVSR